MAKKTETFWDPNSRSHKTREVGTDDDLLVKDKVQDVSGLAAAAKDNKAKAAPKAEEDVSKMSPLQKASYLAKKKKQQQEALAK